MAKTFKKHMPLSEKKKKKEEEEERREQRRKEDTHHLCYEIKVMESFGYFNGPESTNFAIFARSLLVCTQQ